MLIYSMDSGHVYRNFGHLGSAAKWGTFRRLFMLPETGFLPFSRANFLMDFVVLAMAIIIPIMLASVVLVRYWKNYSLHRKIQIALGSVLGITLIVFEIDVRINGWRHLAASSPYYDTAVYPSLIVHLAFAIPTFFLWLVTIIGGIKYYRPDSDQGTRFHKIMGRFSAVFMLGTAVTGWIFFWLAFVA